MRNFPFLSLQEAYRRCAAGAVLIDVRSPEEYAKGHPIGSISVPLAQLPGQIRSIAAPLQAVLLYCTGGERSLSAARVLQKLGYKRLFIVK